MIPYFQYNAFLLGPLTIQVWGLFVSFGIIASILLVSYLAKKYFLSKNIALDLSVWSIVGGFIGARFFHVIFYNLDYYLINPAEIIKFWHGGASSLGGFFGAAVAVWLFAKRRKFNYKELLPYFDIGAVSLWLGWGIGRIGCFLIHDHPGTLTNFIGGINYPNFLNENGVLINGARHDLGLYESILGFIIFAFCFLFFKRIVKKGWGYVAGLSFGFYAFIRFFLDFLRATDLAPSDVRYAYLTPAQWGMATIVLGLTLFLIIVKMRRLKNGEVN